MKINEVEQLVGITKRNIRFYEKEGLLSPGRNADNGYRDYTEGDVDTLRKIKLLRKLDVAIDEIRKMQLGVLTLDDGLRRHVIQLERERSNLATIRALCQTLADADVQLSSLDAGHWLEEMEQMEERGTRFMNVRKRDTITRYAGPVAAALAFIALMAGLMVLMIWGLTVEPEAAPPVGLTVFLVALPAVVILGVLLALWQRIKQIQGGEEDAAAKY